MDVKLGEEVNFFEQLAKKLGRNWHIAPNIWEHAGPIFTKQIDVGDKLTFILWSAQGCWAMVTS